MKSINLQNARQTFFHAMYSRLDAALSDWPVEKMLKVLPMLIPFMKIGAWFKTYFKRNKV